MNQQRYRIDIGTIIDQKTGDILTLTQVRNKLNTYEKRLIEKDYLLSNQLTVNENLHKTIRNIENICTKYNIPIEDIAETLEEYICLDNGEEL